MTCKCTCGGCDRRTQFKVTLFPNAAAAAPAVGYWNAAGFGMANGANPQMVTIRYDTTACAPAYPPLLGDGWHIAP